MDDMDGFFGMNHGDRNVNVYPISEHELSSLQSAAWGALTIVGIPFLIIEVLMLVRRLRRETTFQPITAAHREVKS